MSRDPTIDPANAANDHVSFGSQTVPREARQSLVNEVFHKVADRYDVMNDLMSGGLHRLWKQDLITKLHPPKSARAYRLLDVAGGTGDVALSFIERAGSAATAIVCDINADMLAVANTRIAERQLSNRISTTEGNGEQLPFSDGSFDGYSIAFGIRNVTDIPKALREAYRVLKIGGRFACLEFSHVDMPLLDRLYDTHSFEVIPRIGKLVTGERAPYDYLVESIRKFPNQADFAEMIAAAGFAQVSYTNLTGGIAAIHTGWKV